MKYLLSENVQIDSFSDGESVVYDGNNEVLHILNQTADKALKLILEHGETAISAFIQQILEQDHDIPVDVLEKDFKNILNDFLEAGIIIIR